MAHARLGPSNKRWPECPGSVREEERYEDVAGAAAIDGTGSHLLLEMCMDNNVQAAQYDQQIIGTNHPDNMNGWMVQPDRIKRVQMCLDYISRRVGELKQTYEGCTVTVESEGKADPGGAFGRDDWWGTVDITIIARHPMTGEVYFMEVADYKDGRGYVSQKNNTQLISYLFGKMRPYVASGPDMVRPFIAGKVPQCRVTIVQPKTNPPVRYQCSTRPEDGFSTAVVIEYAERLAAAAQETDNPKALCNPGKHCQWCKANPKRGGHCDAESQKSLMTVESMSDQQLIASDADGGGTSLFEYIGKAVADPKSLTPGQLADLADARDGIMAAFDKVTTEIQDRIEQGLHVPGYAMQPGRSSRVWAKSEEEIVKALKGRRLTKDDIFPPKLISVAQALKSDKLDDKQKARLEKDFVAEKAGKMSLKKVSRDHQAEKSVGQSSTADLQSAEMMFGDVAKPDTAEPEVKQEISFF